MSLTLPPKEDLNKLFDPSQPTAHPGRRVELTKAEQELAEWIATRRVQYNNGQGCSQSVINDDHTDNWTNHRNAYGAELAISRLFNLRPDFETTDRQRHDLKGNHNATLDVKWTDREYGRLLVKDKPAIHTDPADFYLLTVGVWPFYEYRGYMEGKEILQPHRYQPAGIMPAACYAARQNELEL